MCLPVCWYKVSALAVAILSCIGVIGVCVFGGCLAGIRLLLRVGAGGFDRRLAGIRLLLRVGDLGRSRVCCSLFLRFICWHMLHHVRNVVS